jgi:fused signal recognition particle receptor
MAVEASAGPGLFARLRVGLARSSERIASGLGAILGGRRVDAATLVEIEELLIAGDLGVAASARLTADLAKALRGKDATAEDVKRALAERIAGLLAPVARPFVVDRSRRPFVVLVMGVNGTGKTTTIGKLAKRLGDQGLRVMLVAGDTFRAAAIEQLKVWGERAGAPVAAREQGADAAGLAYEALGRAKAEGHDVVLIDTAGRLHNRAELMDELRKLVRVTAKQDPSAPHARLLVLDATTGQNAHNQVETFRAMADVSGLIVTKLDGTAKGGVVVALAERFGVPVHFIGIGEGADDLRPFEADAFARALVGLDAPQ